MNRIQLSLIILSVFLSGLATAQSWETELVTKSIDSNQMLIFQFPESPVLHFNVSCTKSCDVRLMTQSDFLSMSLGNNVTDNFQSLSTFNSALTMVNFKLEKHTLVVFNPNNHQIFAQVVISNQEMSAPIDPNQGMTLFGSIVFYLSIFIAFLYLKGK
jgi:hypothetical protein